MSHIIEFTGGFHNSSPMRLRFNHTQYQLLSDGYPLAEILTRTQERRLDNHFCGIKGCLCGSYSRATWEEV